MDSHIKFVGDRAPTQAQRDEINRLLEHLRAHNVDIDKVVVVTNPYNQPNEFAYNVPADTPAKLVFRPKTMTGNSVYRLPVRRNATETTLAEHRDQVMKALASGASAAAPNIWHAALAQNSDGVSVGFRRLPRRGGFETAILVNGRDDAAADMLEQFVRAKNLTVEQMVNTPEFTNAHRASSAARNVLAYKAARALGFSDDELAGVDAGTLIKMPIAPDSAKMLQPAVENNTHGVHMHTNSYGEKTYVVVENMANINERSNRGSVIVTNGPKYGFDVLTKGDNENWTNPYHNVFPTHTSVTPTASSPAKQFEKNNEVKNYADWDGHMPFYPDIELEYSTPNHTIDNAHGWKPTWKRDTYENSFTKLPEPQPEQFQINSLIDHAKRSKSTTVTLRVDSDSVANLFRNWKALRDTAGVKKPADLLTDTVDADHVRVPVAILEKVV